MDSLTNLMFYSYYAEDDDLDQMQNNLAKDYHKIFIETKSDHPVITGAGYKSALKNRNYVFVADSLIFSHPSVIDITNDKFRKMHPEYDLNYLNLS